MHVAYSAIQQFSTSDSNPEIMVVPDHYQHEPLLRYQAYKAACQKLNKEIIEIQKYMPGWMPVFR